MRLTSRASTVRALSLLLLLLVGSQIGVPTALATSCADDCSDEADGMNPCSPLCTLCIHSLRAVVEQRATSEPPIVAMSIATRPESERPLHLPADVFHVPLRG